MATKKQQMQSIIRLYREKTGEKSVEMHEVARFAVGMGWPLPKPKAGIDLLSEMFSGAAREEHRRDPVTGHSYRANLAVTVREGIQQFTLWTDIDEAPRHVAQKAFVQRREQMVGDAVQLSRDADHWNRVNPSQEPIQVPLDFGPDVEWRNNSPADDSEEKAA